MRKISILLSISLLSLSMMAQKVVNGTVKDAENNSPLAYCSVLLTQADTISLFAITDDKGYFEIPTTPGKYSAVIRFVGYITDTIPVNMTNKDVFLGNIKLKPDTKVLDELVVKESARKIEIDKNEVVVTDEMRAGTATTSDVLDKVDGVSYDRYNDEIKVDSESNVLLLVNGLEKDQKYIKNINPDRIAKVEVIRDPGGRYGLEGYSAIINVKLKQNYVGQEIFINNMNVIDYDAPVKSKKMPMNNAYLNYNFTRKTLNIYAQAWAGSVRFGMLQSSVKDYDSGLRIDQRGKDGDWNGSLDKIYSYVTLGADYQLSPKHTVSLETHFGGSPKNNYEGNYIYRKFLGDSLTSTQDYYMKTKSHNTNLSGTAFYLGNYSDDKTLNADVTLGRRSSGNYTGFEFDSSGMQDTETSGTENYVKMNVEWTQNLNEKFSYQIGYGLTSDRMENKQILSTNEIPVQYVKTDLRNRGFLYGTYRILKPLTIKAGMAIENSLPTLNDKKQVYTIYKPHLDIQYKPLKQLSVKLQYRSDVDYPSLNQVDPTEIIYDAHTSMKGNPYLEPSTVNKLTAKVSVMGGFASVSAFYNFSNDYIARVGMQEGDRFIYTYDNLGKYVDQGIRFNFTVPFGKKLFWQNNAKLYKSKIEYGGNVNNIKDWRGESNLMYVDKKSGMWAGVMFQKSNSHVITTYGYKQMQNDFWAVLAQKPFFQKKLSIMLMYMLPINFLADYTQNTVVNAPTYSQEDIVDLNMVKNIFLFKINYRFHYGKEIKKIEKKIEREKQESGGFF